MELNLKGPLYPKRAHSARCIHLVGREGDQELNSFLEVFTSTVYQYIRLYARSYRLMLK